MTSEEKQEIISAILSSIRTNSKTITQLTPVMSYSISTLTTCLLLLL